MNKASFRSIGAGLLYKIAVHKYVKNHPHINGVRVHFRDQNVISIIY